MKYIGMPMGMWVLFSKSFRDKLISVFGYRAGEADDPILRQSGKNEDRKDRVLEVTQ